MRRAPNEAAAPSRRARPVVEAQAGGLSAEALFERVRQLYAQVNERDERLRAQEREISRLAGEVERLRKLR